MKIDPKKQYRTRGGQQARIYAGDGARDNIHGAILRDDGWDMMTWRWDGRRLHCEDHKDDLIEVRPRHKRTVWLNVYNHNVISFFTKENADRNGELRIACIKVELDFEEGEGL